MRRADLKEFKIQLTLLSLVGLVATFWQTAEKIQMLKFPEDPLNCNLSPVVDCAGVFGHHLSAVFGVPNSMIGMVAFSFLLSSGLWLWMGGEASKTVKKAVLAVSLIMFAFSVWFFAVSLYIIGKICIFCIFIWLSSVALSVLAVREYGDAYFAKHTLKAKRDWIKQQPWQAIILIYVVGILLFFYRFREYYFN